VAAVRKAFKELYSEAGYVKEWQRIFGLKLNFIPGADADRIMGELLAPAPGWDFLNNEFLPKLRGQR
jgi:hypothetical protein